MPYLMLVRAPENPEPEPTEPEPTKPAPTGQAEPEGTVPVSWLEFAGDRWITGERLRPSQDATCVRVREGRTVISHGPFVEVSEQIAGFDLLAVDTEEEAVAIAAAHPVAQVGALELRELRMLDGDLEPWTGAPVDYVMLMARESATPAEDFDDSGWLDRWLALDVSRGGAPTAPPAEAVTVRVRGGETLVTRGPFAELQEYVDGYDLIQAPDLDTAIAAAATHPSARLGVIEIRPVWPF